MKRNDAATAVTFSCVNSSNIRRRSRISSVAILVIRTSTTGPCHAMGITAQMPESFGQKWRGKSAAYRRAAPGDGDDDRRARHIAADHRFVHVGLADWDTVDSNDHIPSRELPRVVGRSSHHEVVDGCAQEHDSYLKSTSHGESSPESQCCARAPPRPRSYAACWNSTLVS